MGVSCTFRGHLALLEGTSLGHIEIGSCAFSKISYGGSWGGMRSPNQISGRAEVVWWVNERFKKNYEGHEVTSRISKWNVHRWGALIGLTFCVRAFLG